MGCNKKKNKIKYIIRIIYYMYNIYVNNFFLISCLKMVFLFNLYLGYLIIFIIL